MSVRNCTRSRTGFRVLSEMLLHVTKAGSQSPDNFQVLGERSSGTNFVKLLIKRNLTLEPTNALGWKHGFPHMLAIPGDTLLICVFRNALDWVLSMHAKPWHANQHMQRMPFSEFLRAPWDSVVDRPGYFGLQAGARDLGEALQHDRHPITGQVFPNLLVMRNAKAASLVGCTNRSANVVLVQYESVVAEPALFLATLADAFDIKRPDQIRAIDRRLGSRFRPAVGDRPDAPAKLSPEDHRFVLSQLDRAMESSIGYEY